MGFPRRQGNRGSAIHDRSRSVDKDLCCHLLGHLRFPAPLLDETEAFRVHSEGLCHCGTSAGEGNGVGSVTARDLVLDLADEVFEVYAPCFLDFSHPGKVLRLVEGLPRPDERAWRLWPSPNACRDPVQNG